MDDAQHRVAFRFGVNDHAQRVKVIDLDKTFVLLIHFAVDAVNRLDASFKRKGDARFCELVGDLRACAFDKVAAAPVFLLDVVFYLFVADGVEITQRQIFQLLLHALHTQPVRQRGINMHSFKRGLAAFVVDFYTERAHIVQPVAQLNENNTHVARHGKEHLAQILDVLVFFVGEGDLHQLGQSVDKIGDVGAKLRLNFGDVNAAVLDGIMQ